MASNINANNIDGTYPVAGVDNDSQGFRTNFTNIKNNLAYAKSELEDLQGKVLLKTALTGTTLNNNLSGTVIAGAEIYDFRETEIDLGTVSGALTLDHAVAHFYNANTSGSVSISFTNFPTNGKIGRIRFKIVVNSVAHTLTLPVGPTLLGTDGIEGLSSTTITFISTGTYIFEFITDDQGTTIHVQDLSRPRYPTSTNMDWSSAVPNFNRYVYANVGNNFSVSAVNTLYIDSVKVLNLGNVYLPASPSDGQLITISSNNQVQSLRIVSNTGVPVLGNVSSLSSNSNVKFQYVAGATPAPRWFKL
jgi:hypothetical protein